MKDFSEDKLQYFMRLAVEASSASKDPSTKVGAILVRPDKSIASTGYNGFPKRMPDYQDILNPNYDGYQRYDRLGRTEERRNKKLLRTIHAECNCLDHRRDCDITGYSIFITCHPCSACALRICNTGITNVYYLSNIEFEERWNVSVMESKQLLRECDINLTPMAIKKGA